MTLNGLKKPHFNEDFTKVYNEYSNAEYFIEAHVQYPEFIMIFHNDLPFLSERIKIENF